MATPSSENRNVGNPTRRGARAIRYASDGVPNGDARRTGDVSTRHAAALAARTRRQISAARVAIVLLITLIVGCAKIDFKNRLPWQKEEEKPPIPTRMTAVWTNTVMNQPAQPGVRGFGGRIVFYGEDQQDSLTVEGTLTVYAFDDTEQQAAGRAPTKKFVFLPEHLPSHQSQSVLGASYSFWIPWDSVGGEPRTISLITRFEDQSGRVILSDPTRLILPGLEAEVQLGNTTQQHPEQPVSFETPAPPETKQSPLETTTITVPKNFVAGPARVANREVPQGSTYDDAGPSAPILGPPPSARATSSDTAGAMRTAKESTGAEESQAPEDPTVRQSEPASGHYGRPRRPAPSAQWPRPTRRPFAKRPHPAGWPSGHPE